MDKNDILIGIFAILFSFLIFGTFGLSIYLDMKNKPKVTSGTFHMKYGGAVCAENYITECGVHLLKCDGRVHEYHCMHDVSFILDREELKD